LLIIPLKKDNSFKVLLTTIFKSAEGLNLKEANHVIILEFWWNPQKIFQAIGRIDRSIQKKDIFVYLLCYNENNEVCKYEKNIEAQKVLKLQPDIPEIEIFSNELTFKDELNDFLYDFNNLTRGYYFIKNNKNVMDHDEIIRKERERKEAEKKEKEENEKQQTTNLGRVHTT
jgi:hypothetical protein